MHLIHFAARPGAGEARVRFTADDPVFAGHFPRTPVLPGVVLIDASVGLVARAHGRALRLERLASVKFIRTVAPGDEIDRAFTAQPDPESPERIRANVRWLRGPERVAEMAWTAVPDAAAGEAPT